MLDIKIEVHGEQEALSALDKLSKKEKERQEAFDKTNASINNQKKTLEQLEKELKDFRIAKEKAFDDKEVEKLNKKINETEKKIDKINSSGVNLKTGKSKKSINDLKKRLEDLTKARDRSFNSKAIERFNKKIKETQSEIGNLDKLGVEPTKKSLFNLNGVAGKLKGVLVAAFIADKVIEFGKEVFNASKELKSFRTQAQQVTQLTGEGLDEVTVRATALARTYDKSFDEILLATNNFSKQQNISFDEAFTLVEKGFQQGADASGDFLDKIKEYPIQFKNFGLSAEETIKIATQEIRGGIFDDKLSDTIKEAGLSLREFTKAQEDALTNAFGKDFSDQLASDINSGLITSEQAFDRIAKKIAQSGLSVQELQTLTSSVFKGAGEDVGGVLVAIENYNQALGINLDETTELGKAQQRQLELNQELADVQNELSKELAFGIEQISNLGTQTKLYTQKFLLAFIRGFKDAITTVRSFFGSVLTKSSKILKRIGIDTDLVADSLRSFFGVPQKKKDAFQGVFKSVRKEIKITQEDIDGLVNALDNLAGNTATGKFIKGLFDKEDVKEVKKGVTELTQAQKDAIKEQAKIAEREAQERFRRLQELNLRELNAQRQLEQAKLQVQIEGLKERLNQEGISNAEKINIVSDINDLEIELLRKKEEDALNILELNESSQIVTKQQTASEKEKIEVDFQAKLNDINLKGSQEREQILKDFSEREKAQRQELLDADTSELMQLDVLRKELDEGLITIEEFEKEQSRIVEENEQERLDIRKTFIQEELELPKISFERQKSLEEELTQIKKQELEKQIEDLKEKNKEEEEAEKEKWEKIKEISVEANSVLSESTDILFAFGQQKRDAELEQLQAQKESELALVGDNEQAKAFIEEKFRRKELQIKRKQAKADKQKALFDIFVNTASAVVQALPNIPLSIFAGVLGAAQLALVASRPLPKFFKGSDNIRRLNGEPMGRDTIPAMLNEGEGIVPTAINQELLKTGIGATHPDLPKYVGLGKFYENKGNQRAMDIDYSRFGREVAKNLPPRIIQQFTEDSLVTFYETKRQRTKIYNKKYEM